LILFALAIWLGKRDYRHTDRSRWVPDFIALRLGAIVALLWTLLGPTYIRTQTHNVTKSLAILVDQSASMKLVDPIDESGNNVRWLKGTTSETKELRQIDAELGRIAAAGAMIRKRSTENLLPGKVQERENQLESIRVTLSTSVDQLRSIANGLPSHLSVQTDSLRHVIEQFESNLLGSFDPQSLVSELSQGNTSSIRSLAEQCDSTVRSLGNLADRLAEMIESSPNNQLERTLEVASALSRSDKVHQELNRAETSWLSELEEKVSISRYQFGGV